jgi:DNA-binding NtrC family response regulator
MSAKRVLIVPMRWPLAERLRADGYDVVEADTADDAVERADAGVDVVLLDVSMPGEAALGVLASVRDRDPDPPIILLAHREDAAMVTTALAGGAFDYAYEPIDADDIARRVVRAFEVTRLRRELRTLRDRLARPFTLASLVGVSPAMERVRALTRKVAASDDAPVLLVGARGTGRDHVARVIHYSGGRAMRPFLKVPCAALAGDALEAELFGSEPLPGEDGSHARGVFDEAHEGTILLDDVDRLAGPLQGRLLRYLESRQFQRVGGITDIRVDVRIIATSSRPIESHVAAGTFPPDLFYRLNVLGFEIPPLSAHREDVIVLARHFVEQNRRARRLDIGGLSAAAESALAAYDWPGNIDELRAVIDRAVMIASGRDIEPAHLGLIARAQSDTASQPFRLPDDGCNLDDVERSLVLQALDRAGGNQTRAATLLGVHRDQIRYRLGKYRKDTVPQ